MIAPFSLCYVIVYRRTVESSTPEQIKIFFKSNKMSFFIKKIIHSRVAKSFKNLGIKYWTFEDVFFILTQELPLLREGRRGGGIQCLERRGKYACFIRAFFS